MEHCVLSGKSGKSQPHLCCNRETSAKVGLNRCSLLFEYELLIEKFKLCGKYDFVDNMIVCNKALQRNGGCEKINEIFKLPEGREFKCLIADIQRICSAFFSDFYNFHLGGEEFEKQSFMASSR